MSVGQMVFDQKPRNIFLTQIRLISIVYSVQILAQTTLFKYGRLHPITFELKHLLNRKCRFLLKNS